MVDSILSIPGDRVEGSGFKVLGFSAQIFCGVQVSGFRIQVLGFRFRV